MRFGLIAFTIMCLMSHNAGFADVSGSEPKERICYSAADTRAKIAEKRLVEPFGLMRMQAGQNHADAISVRLCRIDGDYVYEIDLLRRDGRLIHTRLDAASGKPLADNLRP